MNIYELSYITRPHSPLQFDLYSRAQSNTRLSAIESQHKKVGAVVVVVFVVVGVVVVVVIQTYIESLVKIGSGTAEILMTDDIEFVVGGGGGVKSFSCQTQLFS